MDTGRDRKSYAAELERAIDELGGVVGEMLVESNNLEKILLGNIPGNVTEDEEKVRKEIEPGGVFEKLRKRVVKINGEVGIVHDRLLEFIKESDPRNAS